MRGCGPLHPEALRAAAFPGGPARPVVSRGGLEPGSHRPVIACPILRPCCRNPVMKGCDRSCISAQPVLPRSLAWGHTLRKGLERMVFVATLCWTTPGQRRRPRPCPCLVRGTGVPRLGGQHHARLTRLLWAWMGYTWQLVGPWREELKSPLPRGSGLQQVRPGSLPRVESPA